MRLVAEGTLQIVKFLKRISFKFYLKCNAAMFILESKVKFNNITDLSLSMAVRGSSTR